MSATTLPRPSDPGAAGGGGRATTRAVVFDAFGGVDALRLAERPVPAPGRGELQVAPAAVSVNPLDGKIRRGELKLLSGRHFPMGTGMDFAGHVTAVGPGTTGFAVGDAVWGCLRGMHGGALADRVVVPAEAVAPAPAGLDLTTAASVPMVGQAALTALTHVAPVGPGSRVLVFGCTGGFGLFAVQVANLLGAHVTGVGSGEGLAVARDLGADEVVDHRAVDVTTRPDRYDVVLELSGHLPFDRATALLTDDGAYVDVSPSPTALVGGTLANAVRHRKHKFLMMKSRTEQLEQLAAWFADGSLRPVPVRVLPLASFAEAFRLVEAGGVVGKVVVDVRDAAPVGPVDPGAAAAAPAPTRPAALDLEAVRHSADVLDSWMTYLDAGTGPTVLLLHGNPMSSYLWRGVLPHLVDQARCVAPDLIGMGRSGKPDVAYRFADQVRYLDALVDRLDLGDVTLVLHDWGSALGFHWANRHRDRVRGIAFLEAVVAPIPSWDAFPPGFGEQFRAFRGPEGRALLVEQNAFLEQVLPSAVVRPLTEAEHEEYRRPFRRAVDREPLWRFPNELPIAGEPADVHQAVSDYAAWFAASDLPKLLLSADPGALIPPAYADALAASLPRTTHVRLGAGVHYLQEDHPDAIGSAVAEWHRDVVLAG